ncbi:hypothetical protein [Sandaracinus amylolyticus]|uniref:hypothetical protein n=1 Tax=Sandaracinus amylolyticus TaxID=927083 RepID=UPI001F2E91CF|nr:hypothetical protein [Sandaracinus amylolyticus]UJR85880.1 Hypothetical protein I5071_79600 [Sandaracinus amylolyticus]
MKGAIARVGLAIALLTVGCGDDDVAAPIDAGSLPDAGPPPPPPSEPGRHDVEVIDTSRIVPSEGLPAETAAMHSNNNLDVVRFEGRVYLAWRTAPDHFASPEARIHVVSSEDERTWRHEASFHVGSDLREPRFLVLPGTPARLFLYVTRLGTSRFDFEPQGVHVSERASDGTWSELALLEGLERHLAWRTRVERDVPYMTAYLGGEMIYDFVDEPRIEVDLLTTSDGRTWTPVSEARRSVYVGGGSETDFALADDGSLHGVIRLEAGDASGFGSRVCSAPADDLTQWSCVTDPRKYDSPLVFAHDGEIYLIARRNVTETGHYDLMTSGAFVRRVLDNQLAYSSAPKRCALWRFVQGEQRIAFVIDLPSRGDTCFPAMISGARQDELVVYDYSSDVEGPDVDWNDGQTGDTFVYRHVLRFTAR